MSVQTIAYLIARAMRNADNLALRMVYKSERETTTRIVSPVRWINHEVFCALCLGREQCRNFRMDRVVTAELVNAADVVMPETIRSDRLDRSD